MLIKITKKAAMFGLDARIALAIFGALSVISGAALYSAIQQSKVISIANQISEITKAFEQYYLDTGSPIRKIGEVDAGHSNLTFSLSARDLIEDSGINGWNGPYISLDNPSDSALIGVYNFVFGLIRADIGTWGSPGVITPVCSIQETCNMWVQVNVESGELARQLELHYDGTETLDSGRVRIRADNLNVVFYNTGIKYTNM